MAHQIQGWTNFFQGARLFGRVNEKKRVVKTNVYLETQLETLLFVPYYLNRTCSLHFKCVSCKSFWNEAFVAWLVFECLKWDAPQKIIFILQTHPSKGAKKNMLKAWSFTKNKICHRWFDNNWKNSSGHILLILF